MAFGAIALTFLLNFPIFAQTSDNASGTAQAGILVPITVKNDQNINFGTVILPPDGFGDGWVEFFFYENGSFSASPWNDKADIGHLGDQIPGKVTITGEPGINYYLELPATTLVNSSDPSKTIYMYDWNGNLGPGSINTMPESGEISHYLPYALEVAGGDLVQPASSTGTYTGTYTITVHYIHYDD